MQADDRIVHLGSGVQLTLPIWSSLIAAPWLRAHEQSLLGGHGLTTRGVVDDLEFVEGRKRGVRGSMVGDTGHTKIETVRAVVVRERSRRMAQATGGKLAIPGLRMRPKNENAAVDRGRQSVTENQVRRINGVGKEEGRRRE